MTLNNLKIVLLFLVCCLLSCATLKADVSETENTFKYVKGEPRFKATLDDVSWLVGSWTGEAFGSRFEETFNSPSNGSMVGMFKLLSEDSVQFYELILIVEEEGSLALKVKHFNADFSAWEDKPDYINFPLVKIEKNAIHFSGLSFYKKSDKEIDAYIVFRKGEEVTEHKLIYKKIDATE